MGSGVNSLSAPCAVGVELGDLRFPLLEITKVMVNFRTFVINVTSQCLSIIVKTSFT